MVGSPGHHWAAVGAERASPLPAHEGGVGRMDLECSGSLPFSPHRDLRLTEGPALGVKGLAPGGCQPTPQGRGSLPS